MSGNNYKIAFDQNVDPHTLVSLFFDLELLRQVLVLLPLYVRADRAIVHKIAGITDLLLIEVSLLKDFIFEVVIRAEDKANLESGFW